MNIQTERLENHTARFTVEVDNERLEQAKKVAAGRLAKRVNIPGFRKGKAPYQILVNYLGEGTILEDAVEVLGNEIYKDALSQAEIEPYGPGALEDFAITPQPTFKFIVPLQPSVDLGDYRSVRLDYDAPQIEDKAIDDSLKALQERQALIEESHQPVAQGNRVTVKLIGTFLDEDDDDEQQEDAEVAETETESEPDKEKSSVFIDRDDMIFLLTEDREPAPGFSDALIGANVGDQREFEITYPDDEAEYEGMAGRKVKFNATINKIETMTLPVLNDEFAARVTESDEKQLTLLELRMKIRDDLQKATEEKANNEYADRVLHEIIEGATASFPDALVEDQTEHILEHVDADLRKRGLTLQDYMKVSNKTREDLYSDYRDQAVHTIEHALVQQEIIRVENIQVTDEQIDAEIDKIIEQFGEQASSLRRMYDRRDMRDNLRSQLINRQFVERITAIAKGESPDEGQPAETAAPSADANDEAE